MSENQNTPNKERGQGRTIKGTVVSNKGDKTIVVKVEHRVRHPRYNKFMKRSVKYHAHVAENSCNIGDTVVLAECAPISKNKKWRLRTIAERSTAV